MLHLAAGNVFLIMNATDQPALPWLSQNMETRASAQAKDSVMYYVTTSYDYCINAVKNCDMSKWGETKKMFGRFECTRLPS